MLIDLHVHTRLSEGSGIDAEVVIEKAAAAGLDGICFTDRDTIEGLQSIEALRRDAAIRVFAGTEITSDHGRLLCFFPEPTKVPPLERLLGERKGGAWPVRESVAAVRAAGGAVVAAHPYERAIEQPMGDFIFTLEGLAAVESYAASCSAQVNELAIEAADRLGLASVGGSCAHESVEAIGSAATLFLDEIRDEAELVEALNRGRVWAVAIGSELRFAGDTPRRDHRDRRPRDRRRHQGRRPRGR